MAEEPIPEADETVVAYATILMLGDLLYELAQRDRALASALAKRFAHTLETPFAKSMPRASKLIRSAMEGLEAEK